MISLLWCTLEIIKKTKPRDRFCSTSADLRICPKRWGLRLLIGMLVLSGAAQWPTFAFTVTCTTRCIDVQLNATHARRQFWSQQQSKTEIRSKLKTVYRRHAVRVALYSHRSLSRLRSRIFLGARILFPTQRASVETCGLDEYLLLSRKWATLEL